MASAALAARDRQPSFSLAPLWIAPPLLVLAALFFYPLSLIAAQSFTGADGLPTLAQFARVVSSPLFGNALLHTIEIATAASAGCLLLGFTLALILSFVPFPGA